MTRKIVLAAISVLLVPILLGRPVAIADDAPEIGVQLAEGLWLFDISVRMPMQSSPTIQTMKACVGSEPLTASRLMPWAEKQGCKIRGVKEIENGIKWKLRCSVNGQKSKGKGEFTVVGEEGSGKARVNFEMAGQRMSITTKWDAKRLGSCPDAGEVSFTPTAAESAEKE